MNSLVSYGIAIGYLVVGVINFLPIIGALSAAQLERLYGIEMTNPPLTLLMQHRAILLGIVGGMLIAAAFVTPLRTAAGIAGLISMLSYMGLIFFSSNSNSNLIQVAWIDVGAVAILVVTMAVVYITAESSL